MFRSLWSALNVFKKSSLHSCSKRDLKVHNNEWDLLRWGIMDELKIKGPVSMWYDYDCLCHVGPKQPSTFSETTPPVLDSSAVKISLASHLGCLYIFDTICCHHFKHKKSSVYIHPQSKLYTWEQYYECFVALPMASVSWRKIQTWNIIFTPLHRCCLSRRVLLNLFLARDSDIYIFLHLMCCLVIWQPEIF